MGCSFSLLLGLPVETSRTLPPASFDFWGSSEAPLLINDLKVTDSLCSKKSDLTTIQQQMRSEKLASFSLLRRIFQGFACKKGQGHVAPFLAKKRKRTRRTTKIQGWCFSTFLSFTSRCACDFKMVDLLISIWNYHFHGRIMFFKGFNLRKRQKSRVREPLKKGYLSWFMNFFPRCSRWSKYNDTKFLQTICS